MTETPTWAGLLGSDPDFTTPTPDSTPQEILWRAVVRHGTWDPNSRHPEELPDIPHMLACGLALRPDQTDPDWGVEHWEGDGRTKSCDLSGPGFSDCIVCRCGSAFGVFTWSPSPAELVAAVIAEMGEQA